MSTERDIPPGLMKDIAERDERIAALEKELRATKEAAGQTWLFHWCNGDRSKPRPYSVLLCSCCREFNPGFNFQATDVIKELRADAERWRFIRPHLMVDGDCGEDNPCRCRHFAFIRFKNEIASVPDGIWAESDVDTAVDAAIGNKKPSQTCMEETYVGRVITSEDGNIEVRYYLPNNDLVDHSYHVSQFKPHLIPKKGDRLAVQVRMDISPDPLGDQDAMDRLAKQLSDEEKD